VPRSVFQVGLDSGCLDGRVCRPVCQVDGSALTVQRDWRLKTASRQIELVDDFGALLATPKYTSSCFETGQARAGWRRLSIVADLTIPLRHFLTLLVHRILFHMAMKVHADAGDACATVVIASVLDLLPAQLTQARPKRPVPTNSASSASSPFQAASALFVRLTDGLCRSTSYS
jgi:hypothetical protein